MNGREAVKTALASTQHLLNWFLSDLSDADLLVRPVPGSNHIAWQLGHLIQAEPILLGKMLPAAQYAPLPADFADRHSSARANEDSPANFLTKAEYLAHFQKGRDATLAAVERLSDADLDRPTEGPMAQFAPTLGALLILAANHTLMHAGQFSVVRRKLGKPVLF